MQSVPYFVTGNLPRVLLVWFLFSTYFSATNAGFLCPDKNNNHQLTFSVKNHFHLWGWSGQNDNNRKEKDSRKIVEDELLFARKDNLKFPSCSFPLRTPQRRRRRRQLLLLFSGLYATPLVSATTATAEQIPDECKSGSLVAENAIPGAYQQICMTLSERQIPLKATKETLTIRQGDAVGAGRTGVAVWNSGLLLTRLLDALVISNSQWLQGKTVMELGCGTALASIAVAKLGAQRVIATDGNPDVVELAQQNINRNFVLDDESSSSEDRLIMATPLSWGFLDASDYMDTADLIIGSDLTYNSGTWKILAETFGTILKPGGIVLYLSLGHAGFNVNGELNGFLSVVTSLGQLEVLTDSNYYASGSSTPNNNIDLDWPLPVSSVSKLLSQCISKEEQTLLNGTGGAKVVVLRKKIGRKFK